jgi:hypothetical protein
MKYDKVIIKQIPDDNSAAIGLKAYNRSRFPRCFDMFPAVLLPDGRYNTGLDPDGFSVMSIQDPVLREEKRAELRDLSLSLGTMLQKDLSPRSTFWDEYLVKISTDQDLTLNRMNPLDVIAYHVLISNGYAAPNKSAISAPEYRNAAYYCHIDEVESDVKVSSSKKRDRARAELYKMAEDKEKMLLIGSYLEGARYKKTMKENTLYDMLSDFIDNKAQPENVDTFLRAVTLSPEDLQYKVTIETAIRKKIIKFKEGQYYRGGVNFGRNQAEVIKNLKLPDFTNEFVSIHEEVNRR